MRRSRTNSVARREQGIIITLVAVFMLIVVGAMAALSIDVVSFYTARSEAQLAADGGALAGARVLANSGITSSGIGPTTSGLIAAAEVLARNIATQVAQQNQVGGSTPQVTVTFNDGLPSFLSNPQVNVQVKRTDLPTFFARIWGSKTITVAASATAEAYNPSGLANGTTVSQAAPVAPTCVKPWLLPNIDPTNSNSIFDPTSGAIQDYGLLGLEIANPLQVRCLPAGDCSTLTLPAVAWQYYPGAPGSFPAPSSTSVTCSGSGGFNGYERSMAGCVPTAIACNASASSGNGLYIDIANDSLRNSETASAVNCLTHSNAGGGDSINTTVILTPPPFHFIAGADNPIVPSGTEVMVSDSLVTVPVFDISPGVWPPSSPSGPVNIIGFVQLFLNPTGAAAPVTGIPTAVVNMVGCGTGATGTTIFGNGASAVPVRLITPP